MADKTAVITDDSGSMELKVRDLELVTVPIPLTWSNLESSETEIIIDYQKRKPEGRMKKPKPSICIICHASFPSQQLLQLHTSDVHADKRPYHCSHCGKGFANSTQLTVHERIHDPNRFKGEPKFQCDFCDKKYHLKVSLEGHRKKTHLGYKPPKRPSNKVITQHHSIGVRNSQRPHKVVQVFKCPLCDLKFAFQCDMKRHLQCHTREKPYQCQECRQRFVSKTSLSTHMKNRHLNPSNNQRPSRPSFMYRQPCPCTFCGKVFKVPFQLQNHILGHIGERPHECEECGESFRITQGLRIHRLRQHEIPKGQVNELEAYKCRICGEDELMWFSAFQNHRFKVHKHIPFNSELEKSYGCGICGKPYYQKGQAMVCALLKHDPATLLDAMFKFKCPACPEERFGYHSTLALRRHWEKDHADKPLPVHYRAHSGMYNRRDQQEDTLPNVKINMEVAKRIHANGPSVKSEFQLYTEFGLLPVEHKFYRDLKKPLKREGITRTPSKGSFPCHVCGEKMVHQRNMTRHLRMHDEGRIKCSMGRPRKKSRGGMAGVSPKSRHGTSCHICQITFSRSSNLKRHLKLHDADRPITGYNCSLCGKRFRKLKTLGLHEREHANVKWAAGGCAATRRGRKRLRKGFEDETVNSVTVNINDPRAVRTILGNRVASVAVSRTRNTKIRPSVLCKEETASMEAPLIQYSKCRQSKTGNELGGSRLNLNKMLSIALIRVDE